jgi:hypothetical protein
MASSTPEVRTPRAVSVSFEGERLAVELDDDRTIAAPIDWYPRLRNGDSRERGNWQLIGGGGGIHWPDLDEDISIEGLLAGRRSGESPRSFQQWLDGRSTGARPR